MRRAKNKSPEQVARRLARSIMTDVQAARGGYRVVDVASHTDAEHRHMVRSRETRTIRKLTKFEKLERAGILSIRERDACQWYADAHALGYDTVGIIANYAPSAGGKSNGGDTHLARYKAQLEARDDYLFARAGIDPRLVAMFDRVVLDGRPIGRLGLSFRLAVRQLAQRIDHVLSTPA